MTLTRREASKAAGAAGLVAAGAGLVASATGQAILTPDDDTIWLSDGHTASRGLRERHPEASRGEVGFRVGPMVPVLITYREVLALHNDPGADRHRHIGFGIRPDGQITDVMPTKVFERGWRSTDPGGVLNDHGFYYQVAGVNPETGRLVAPISGTWYGKDFASEFEDDEEIPDEVDISTIPYGARLTAGPEAFKLRYRPKTNTTRLLVTFKADSGAPGAVVTDHKFIIVYPGLVVPDGNQGWHAGFINLEKPHVKEEITKCVRYIESGGYDGKNIVEPEARFCNGVEMWDRRGRPTQAAKDLFASLKASWA